MDEVKTNDVSIQHYDFEVIADDRRAAQVGLVTLETDLTIEDELRFFRRSTDRCACRWSIASAQPHSL